MQYFFSSVVDAHPRKSGGKLEPKGWKGGLSLFSHSLTLVRTFVPYSNAWGNQIQEWNCAALPNGARRPIDCCGIEPPGHMERGSQTKHIRFHNPIRSIRFVRLVGLSLSQLEIMSHIE